MLMSPWKENIMRLSTIAALTLLTCIGMGAGAGIAQAHEVIAKDLAISHPWVRATPKGTTLTAGYVKIKNTGKEAEKLIGASMTGAEKGELHTTIVADGIAKMRPLADGVVIGPGETVELKPAGSHIMFTGLGKSLTEDTYVPGTLVFEKAGKVVLEYAVGGMGEGAASGGKDEHEHHQH